MLLAPTIRSMQDVAPRERQRRGRIRRGALHHDGLDPLIDAGRINPLI